jgi:hypothetical protein
MTIFRDSLLLLCIVVAGIFIIPLPAGADDGDVLVRPQFGFGYANIGKEESGSSSHVGVRILQSANEYKKAGLEVTYLDVLRAKNGKEVRYMAAGIVLEQKLRHWFNMSIGTIGYFGLSGAANSPGVVANLGWEPDSTGRCKPFITYRVDSIFTSPVTQINSFSIGASW